MSESILKPATRTEEQARIESLVARLHTMAACTKASPFYRVDPDELLAAADLIDRLEAREKVSKKVLRELYEVCETDPRDYGNGEYDTVFNEAMNNARSALSAGEGE